MKVISIRQPWAWFIIEGPKRFENRDWSEPYARAQLGQIQPGDNLLIHAAKGMTEQEFEDAIEFARGCQPGLSLPTKSSLKRGGIIGMVRYHGIVRESNDPWFVGPLALMFSDPYPLPFEPITGQLGIFEKPV